MTELSHAKEVDDKYVMKVSRHKTSKAGPTPITMTQNTMSNVKAYVKYVRAHWAKEGVNEIFVTLLVNEFQSGGRKLLAMRSPALN